MRYYTEKKNSRQQDFEELYESRKIPLKLGCNRRLTLTTEKDVALGTYNVDLIEKRFQDRQPNLLIDIVDRINHLNTKGNILAQIAFNQENCTIVLRKRNLNFSFNINECECKLKRIEIIDYDREDKIFENLNEIWLKSIWIAKEFVYFNVQCVKTHESFFLRTDKFMIVNSFEPFSLNYKLSQDKLQEFSNFVCLNGSFEVGKCLLYSRHTVVENKSKFNLTSFESHAHEFRQQAGSIIQVNEKTILNTTDLIELEGKFQSNSLYLNASIGQISLRPGSILTSNEEMELTANKMILACGMVLANKVRLVCESKIETSKTSCLEANTQVEVLAKENIIIEGTMTSSSLIQVGEMENDLSLTLNARISSSSICFLARKIKCIASHIERNDVLKIVTSQFEDSNQSTFYSKNILALSDNELMLHGKYFGGQIVLNSKNSIVSSNFCLISCSEYILIISNSVKLFGRLVTNICQVISSFEIITSKNFNLEFSGSLNLFAKNCTLNGNFKSTANKLKSSTIYIGFLPPETNSENSIKTEIINLNAFIMSNVMILNDIQEVNVKDESNINLDNLSINTSNYKDSCESIFNLDNLILKTRDSLIMNGKYEIKDTGNCFCENSIYMNPSLIILNSKKMIISANKDIYLAGRFGIEIRIDFDAVNDIIIENKLEFASTADCMLVRFRCKRFFLKDAATISSRTEHVRIEIDAESVQISNGSILDNFESISVNCKTLSILKSSMNNVSMVVFNVQSYKDDFSTNVKANNLKISSYSSLVIAGKYSRINDNKNKKNTSTNSSLISLSSAQKIVLQKNSLIEFDQISCSAIKNVQINGTCTGNEANFNSNRELIFGKDSSILCKEKVLSEASSLKIDSIGLRCDKEFICVVKGSLIVESNSQVNANKIELKAKNMKNYGYLNANEGINIILNGYFINDFYSIIKGEPFKKIFNERSITFSSFTDSIKKINFYSLKSKSISIVCAIYINLCGSLIETDIFSITALVILELLTVNLAFTSTKNSLVSINFSINLPNIIEIVKSVLKLDTKRLKEIFFKTADYKKAISLFINAFKLIYPMVGTVLSISWNIILLICSLKSTYEKLKILWKKWKKGIENIELCEVIPLIVGMKDFGLQASSIYTSSVALKASLSSSIRMKSENTNEESSSKNESLIIADTFSKVGLMLASSFGPSISNDSLLSLNAMNINLASNINSRSLYSFECNNLAVAQNIYEQFISSRQRSNQIFANTAIFEGQSMETSSKINANQLQITLTDELNQLKNSVITVADATIKCKDLIQKGTFEAKSSDIKVQGVHDLENTAQFKADSGKYETGNTKVKGNLNLNRTEIVSKNITINENGVVVASNGKLLLDSLLNCTGGMLDLNNTETHIVESYKSEINSKCQLTNSVVHANDIEIAGSHKMDNSVMQAKNSLHVTSQADLEVMNLAEFIANELKFDPQTKLKNDSQLNLISKNLNMSKTSSVHGESNSGIFMKAENLINIDSKEIDVDHVSVDAKKLDDSLDFLNSEGKYENIKARENLALKVEEKITIDRELGGKSTVNRTLTADSILVNKEQLDLKGSLNLTATKGDVIVHAKMNANEKQINLISESGNIETGANVNAKDINVFAHDSYKNTADVNASNTAYFEAKTGVIDNIGGKLHGENGFQAFAEKGINNIATEKNVRGAFDTMKKYTPAEITSNSGKVSIVVNNGKFVNDASKVHGNDNVYIYAKDGIESTARTNEYCSYEHKSTGLFGFSSKHEKYYDTQVQKAGISSTNGKIILESEKEINCVATEFESKEKVTFISNESNVHLKDIVTEKRHEVKNTKWWGLTGNNLKESSSSAIETTIISNENFDIIAPNGDVNLKNVIIKTPAKAEFTGKNVILEGTVLNNKRVEERTDLNFSLFGHEIYNSQGVNNIDKMQSSFNQTFQNVNNLFESNNALETGLNAMNAGIDTYNAVANISNNGVQTFISDTLDLPSPNKPYLSVGLSKTSSTQNYQTYGDGSIDVGELVINAKEKAIFEGIPVNVARECEINAKEFTQKGVNLNYSTDVEINKATLDASFNTGNVNLSVSHSNYNVAGSSHLNQQLNVNGELKINVIDYNLENANANVKSISGNIENLNIISNTDDRKANSESFSLSTSGAISYSKSNEESKFIGTASALKVNENIDPDTMKIKNLNIEGGKILSKNLVDMKEIVSGNINVKEVQEYSKKNSSGFSGNIRNILPEAKHTDSDLASKTINIKDLNSSNNHETLPEIKTIDFNFAKSDFKRVQNAVIYGEKGTLINEDVLASKSSALTTTNENGQRIIKDEAFDYKMKIPVKITNDDRHDKKLEKFLNEKKEDFTNAYKFSSLVYKNENDESKKDIPD